MNSEVAIHEYTHLWDNYTQKTNPELWQKGKDIFKNTKFWAEVKADPNYADIADNNDLLLSEVHAQLCGKITYEIIFFGNLSLLKKRFQKLYSTDTRKIRSQCMTILQNWSVLIQTI
jgi:hypothetical protein